MTADSAKPKLVASQLLGTGSQKWHSHRKGEDLIVRKNSGSVDIVVSTSLFDVSTVVNTTVSFLICAT